ncbi:MAG: ATP-binding protein [Planctomycetaceae bacterium]|nr:ATP-binding protein [Planctomycetaceae bacterium]
MLSESEDTAFERAQAGVLAGRLQERRRFLQVVAGPRQVGKTTLVQQVLARGDAPHLYASADEPESHGQAWLETNWERSRLLAKEAGKSGAVLALDEIQKLPQWSETVKRLWDEDTRRRIPLRVVLLGSAPLLLQRGLSESLAGRFEILHLPHWSWTEMKSAFGFSLDQYLFFGGYPGGAALIAEHGRWRSYILDSLVETTVSRDILLLTRVDKPALLRRLFELGCRYSGQILSYTKMLGQLHDAGNTTTLAHYLELLTASGMLTGLQKFSGSVVRSRASIPKLQVLNTAFMSSQAGLTMPEAHADRDHWGRLTESAIGAHLANAALAGECELTYWREGDAEVDFVLKRGRTVVAIEVKSGRASLAHSGLARFREEFRPKLTLLVGGDGIPVGEFLARPVNEWLQA